MHPSRRSLFTVLIVVAGCVLSAFLPLSGTQQHLSTKPQYGIRDKSPTAVAFTNARIIVSPTVALDSASLIVRDGKVVTVGKGVTVPTDARVIDLKGLCITPAFIDPFSDYGVDKTQRTRPDRFATPEYEGKNIGVNSWNDAVHSEANWVSEFKPDSKEAKDYIESGVAVVQSSKLDGIFRGRSFVALLNDGLPNEQVLVPQASHFLSFDKGSSRQEYPSSEMGSIALVRQTLYDAEWHARAQDAFKRNPSQLKPETNLSLEALKNIKSETIVFQAEDELSILRAGKIAAEFGLNQIYLASGFEYTVADQLKAAGIRLLLPVNFPKAPYVKSAEDALDVSLADMRHWELAPSSPAMMQNHQIEFAFTSARLRDKGSFLSNIRKAVKRGLTEQSALAALTTVPARYCGIQDRVSTLEPGKLANFIVSDSSVFNEESVIYSVWIAGQENRLKSIPKSDIRGNYSLSLEQNTWDFRISGTTLRPKGSLNIGPKKVQLDNLESDGEIIQFTTEMDSSAYAGILRFSGYRSGRDFSGTCALTNGNEVSWTAKFLDSYDPASDTTKSDRDRKGRKDDGVDTTIISKLTYPNKAYGTASQPPVENVLIKNATVWTSESDGVLKNTDVLVVDGKFSVIGKNLSAPAGTKIIEATGKHLTAGIIDEHSHIAISRGVNEGSHAITSEVRIGDVVNPEDISIYRTLAGGVTISQLLHGSANPIGGQAQVIKHKWGANADGLKFAPAPPTIKFALGENVKQSHWGDRYTIRYPQTRMGVETVMKDAFLTAREYESAWKKYNSLGSAEKQKTIPPRRDIQLDALVDILNSKMFVHCHSYHQTEILMLMRLAEELGFKVQTFTHILEGFKVADEMREHGASANSFSDWWAYKFEVYDAIPYNAALMTEKGVVSGINSDDSEMARRLNQEAGKSVLYGNMSQEEAIKLVTINPAKQLRINDRVGSIKIGKDADFVIWNGNPLSTYSMAEQTWIEGRNYFSLARDSVLRAEVAAERAALTQKILKSGAGERDGKGEGGFKVPEREWHCDDVSDVWREQ